MKRIAPGAALAAAMFALLIAAQPALALPVTTLRATLSPTVDGSAMHARGRAVYRSEGEVQTVRITIRVSAPNGTVFEAWVPGNEPIMLGTLIVSHHAAEIFVVAPVAMNGRPITVFDQNYTEILTGQFK